jgi:predicted DNA-binding transcriptional regulator AlpA
MKSNLKDLLTSEQVAKILNIQPATLEKARSTGLGDFPPYVKFGRSVRYIEHDVHMWLMGHRVDVRTDGMR